MSATISPGLIEALRAFVGGFTKNLRAVCIGKVVRWDATKQAADIEPLVYEFITEEDGTKTAVKPDIIPLVPIAMFEIGGFRIQATPALGDVLTVLVSDREIETWLQGSGGPTTPETDRSHDINDSIAIPWRPATWAAPLSDIDSGALIIGRADDAGEIRIMPDGTIKAGARGASTRGVARLDDATVVDASTDPKHPAWVTAVDVAIAALAGALVPPSAGTPIVAAYNGAVQGAGGLPTSIAGKITSASAAMEVE